MTLSDSLIERYIHNWEGIFRRADGESILGRLWMDAHYFDFRVVDFFHSEADYVHIYPGVDDACTTLYFFVLSESFDTTEYRGKRSQLTFVATAQKEKDSVHGIINHEEALERMQRWKRLFLSNGTEGFQDKSCEFFKINCFVVPMEDLQTGYSRAYLALKEGEYPHTDKCTLDLIIHGFLDKEFREAKCDEKGAVKDYDTIALVPPYPPDNLTSRFALLYE